MKKKEAKANMTFVNYANNDDTSCKFNAKNEFKIRSLDIPRVFLDLLCFVVVRLSNLKFNLSRLCRAILLNFCFCF